MPTNRCFCFVLGLIATRDLWARVWGTVWWGFKLYYNKRLQQTLLANTQLRGTFCNVKGHTPPNYGAHAFLSPDKLRGTLFQDYGAHGTIMGHMFWGAWCACSRGTRVAFCCAMYVGEWNRGRIMNVGVVIWFV